MDDPGTTDRGNRYNAHWLGCWTVHDECRQNKERSEANLKRRAEQRADLSWQLLHGEVTETEAQDRIRTLGVG